MRPINQNNGVSDLQGQQPNTGPGENQNGTRPQQQSAQPAMSQQQSTTQQMPSQQQRAQPVPQPWQSQSQPRQQPQQQAPVRQVQQVQQTRSVEQQVHRQAQPTQAIQQQQQPTYQGPTARQQSPFQPSQPAQAQTQALSGSNINSSGYPNYGAQSQPSAPTSVQQGQPNLGQVLQNQSTDRPQVESATSAQPSHNQSYKAPGSYSHADSSSEAQNYNKHDVSDQTMSPAQKFLKRKQPSASPMSEDQAQQMFKKDPTSQKKKKSIVRKIVKTLLLLIVFGGLAFGAYLLLYGNKVAVDYKKDYSRQNFESIFSKIESSINTSGVESEKLKSGFTELNDVLDLNTDQLKTVYLGSLNPRYKEAEEFNIVHKDFIDSVKEFKNRYSDSVAFINAIGGSLADLESLSGLDSIDLSTTTAESLLEKVTAIKASCDTSIKNLEAASRPESIVSAAKNYTDGLSELCSGGVNSLLSVTNYLTGKAGSLSADDQSVIKAALDNAARGSKVMLSGAGNTGAATNEVSAYYRGLKEDAENLKIKTEIFKN